MKNPAEIRNFALVGHAASGKTMLSEAMLRCAGVITRMGRIADGTTVSDYHVSEKQRHMSVSATLMHAEWAGKKLNLIDTPGCLDFISEGLGALRVGDFALVVLHAQQGVGVGTDRAWDYATNYDLPKIIALNALDKQHVDFDAVVAAVREHFGRHVFPLTVPVNPGPGFNRILDVLRNEIVTSAADGSGQCTAEPATGEWAGRAAELHRELMEHIAESDDTLMEKYFEQGGLSEEEIRSGIHAAVQRQLFIPLFAVAAEQNTGVARLLDFIAHYGSSPVDRQSVPALDANGRETEVALDSGETVACIFKTMSEAHFGELSCFRVYSGAVTVGADLFNSERNLTERVGQLFVLNGQNREAVNAVGAGDLGAVVKLRNTHTGNTLCSPKHPVTLPKVVYPKPNIHAALVTTVKGEEDKIATGLAALHEEDPTFLYMVDGELHQTIISAQGELHLEVVADRLRRRHNVHVDLAEPRVKYRETIRDMGESKHRHKKQTGGAGQFAEVWLRIEPRPRDTGVEFIQSLVGQNVDRNFVPSVEKGVRQVCIEGVLAGCRVTDVKIDFYDGKMHPVDSKDIAFQIAGYLAFKEAFATAKPVLLEPIDTVAIRAPEVFMGRVMGDLSARRGKILGIETEGAFQVIRATVPARDLYHYSSTLRSLTGGAGVHTEEFSHYEEMPREAADQVIAEAAKRRANHTTPEGH